MEVSSKDAIRVEALGGGKGTVGMPQAACIEKERPFTAAVNGINQKLSILEERIVDLHSKISPVLKPIPGCPEKTCEKDPGVTSEFDCFIGNTSDRLQDCIEKLAEIREQCSI